LSYFYLLEGSKIFFMSSKYFIWIVHVPMSLWEFSYIFWNFRSIFRALKAISEISRIVFALENISKKKHNLSYWAEPGCPTHPAQPLWPGLGPARDPSEHGCQRLWPRRQGAAAASLACATSRSASTGP
jgi:hypothetical protein